MNFASTLWEWLPILALGGGAPALFHWQTGRILAPERGGIRQLPGPPAPSAKDKEGELLQALSERGELIPVTAAMRTTLTANEAAEMLEELAGKGYLGLRVEEGVQSYALPESDRRGVPGAPPGTPLSGPERQAAQEEPAENPAVEAGGPTGRASEAGRARSASSRETLRTSWWSGRRGPARSVARELGGGSGHPRRAFSPVGMYRPFGLDVALEFEPLVRETCPDYGGEAPCQSAGRLVGVPNPIGGLRLAGKAGRARSAGTLRLPQRHHNQVAVHGLRRRSMAPLNARNPPNYGP